MEIIKQYSELYRQIPFEEYNIKICKLTSFKNKEKFINYINYFQIDFDYLIEQILNCRFLKFLYDNEKIKNEIYYILSYGDDRLNDKNLKYISKYYKIRTLNAYNNQNTTTVKPFAKTLKKLYADFNCGIGDNGLEEACNLEELDAWQNPNISTIKPFAKTLKKLHASGNCGIDDNGLCDASNLEELSANCNPKITTVQPFAKTLKKLYAYGNCGIDDNGLSEASNLQYLYSSGNPKITKKLNK